MQSRRSKAMPIVSYYEKPDGSGIRLGYVILGQEFLPYQRPVVCINGIGMILNDWETLANQLSKSRPVLLYDHRGMGESSFTAATTDFEISVPGMVDDLLALIKYLEWSEIDVIAWSMGGFLLSYLLIERDFQRAFTIRHAVFGAASGGLPDCEPGALSTMGDMLAFAESHSSDRGSPEYSQSMLNGVSLYFDRDFVSKNASVVRRWTNLLSSGKRQAKIYAAQGASGIGHNLRQQLHKIPQSIPLLIIHGTKDRIVLPHEADPYLALPQSRPLLIGTEPGKVPNLEFGHAWWEYFTPEIWCAVLNKFFDNGSLS